VIEVKPGIVRVLTPTFGKVEITLKPIDVEVIKVGDGYSVVPTLKITATAERKVKHGPLCNPNLPYIPVEISDSEMGHIKIRVENDEILVYIEAMRVLIAEEASGPDGDPCVLVAWRYGIRVCPRS